MEHPALRRRRRQRQRAQRLRRYAVRYLLRQMAVLTLFLTALYCALHGSVSPWALFSLGAAGVAVCAATAVLLARWQLRRGEGDRGEDG